MGLATEEGLVWLPKEVFMSCDLLQPEQLASQGGWGFDCGRRGSHVSTAYWWSHGGPVGQTTLE